MAFFSWRRGLSHIAVKHSMCFCFDIPWVNRWLILLSRICVCQGSGAALSTDILLSWSREASLSLPAPSPQVSVLFCFHENSIQVWPGRTLAWAGIINTSSVKSWWLLGASWPFCLAMSAFSDAPTSLIWKLLGSRVGSHQGHPWMDRQAREKAEETAAGAELGGQIAEKIFICLFLQSWVKQPTIWLW